MSKESTSSRIPRLDGATTRFALPGIPRPTKLSARPTQMLRPPMTFANPPSLGGLRPPMIGSANVLKKSSSGDRLNSAVNLVSKKTSMTLKKFFAKSEKVSPQQLQETASEKPLDKTQILNKNEMISLTPCPLTRSDTFVRGQSQVDMLGITQDILAQSTPLPPAGKRMASETTQLLSGNTRHVLYTTQSLDATHTAQFGDTIAYEKDNSPHTRFADATFGKTITVSSPGSEMQILGNTVCINSPIDKQMIHTFNTPNLTRTLNAGMKVMGETMCVNSPTEHLAKQLGNTITYSPVPNLTTTLSGSQLLDKLTKVDLTHTVKSASRMMDSTDNSSPATNATYSNPGSSENLQMLDDVSIPFGFEADIPLSQQQQQQVNSNQSYSNLFETTNDGNLDDTIMALAPDKTNMKLPLNSTMNTERLLDLSTLSPAQRHMQLLNLTKDFLDTPSRNAKNNTQLLYMSQLSSSASTTPDRHQKFGGCGATAYQHTPVPAHMMSPMLLKGAQSDLVLPTRTPDEDLLGEPMDVDTTLTAMGARTEQFYSQSQHKQCGNGIAMSLQDVNNPNQKQKSRFSFGLDLTESTLDCSIELIDVSLSSTALSQPNANSLLSSNNMSQSPSSQQLHQQLLKKQNSFDLDESLGILTPDQMKEFLDSATTNTNNLELPLNNINNINNISNNKLALHQMRIDQTPSPEELPLDPVEVKTDISDMILAQQQQQHAAFSTVHQRQQTQQHMQSSSISTEPVSQHTDTELSKTDQMTKSSVSKISTSFITSVTSVTSLDTGYQGDGEMSRPASRGAGDHSPSNGPAARKGGHVSRQPSFNNPQQPNNQLPPIRRQDPMTDSDFFTESDADDIFHRGDRRAQVIDGQLYGPTGLQPATSVFISEDPQMEDSCMESSGIFTDVENRCDEDLAQMRQRQDTTQDAVDLSPDGDADGDDSTETVKSNRESGKCGPRAGQRHESETISATTADATATALGQGHPLSYSQTSSTIQSSYSTDRLSAATLSNRTSYCSVDGSVVNADGKSFSSLEEAFEEQCGAADNNTSALIVKRTNSYTTGNASHQQQQQQQLPLAVPRVISPRKHASLTSLCHVKNSNNNHGANTTETSSSPAFINVQSQQHARSESGTASGSKVSLSDSIKSGGATPPGRYSPRTKTTQKSPNLRSAVNTHSVVRKTHPPNKWDAVMNQIASNKVLTKKNYNDVKSKVSTRVNGSVGGVAKSIINGGGSPASAASPSSSPSVRRSPSSVNNVGSGGPTSPCVPANHKVLHSNKSATGTLTSQPTDTGSNGLQSPQAKRLLQGAAKRGRSYSKDSQKSSQSDLSGSPKLLVAKTPLRAAKKRDVRNLSISPTDLGPPPKTQQTANGTSAGRPKPAAVTLTPKRFTSNGQSVPATPSTAASTPTGNGNGSSIKGSPIAKKLSITTKRFEVKTPLKTPLKDHNRIIGSSPQSNTTTSSKNGSKPETPTDISNGCGGGGGGMHLNNNNNHLTTEKTTTSSTRTSSQTSSPILGHHGKKGIANTTTTAAAALLEKKSQSKLQASRKQLLQKHQRSAEETRASTPPTTEYLDAAELQQLKLLNRHSCNGRLNYEALERHLQQAELVKQQQDKGVEALGVLLQYLVYDLDAFACPVAKTESAKAKDSLSKTLQLLDEAKSSCTELQDQLCDKEAYYTQREEELQALHRCELEKAQSSLSDYQMFAKEQKSALEAKLHAKDAENKRALDSYRLEMDTKFAQKQQHILAAEERERALQERLRSSERVEQELRQKLASSEHLNASSLQAAADREHELNERVKLLSKELETLRQSKDYRERELRDKLNLSQDEISVLRTSHKSFSETMERVSLSPRNSSNSSTSAIATSMELSRLQSEAESLRCVLELKQKEISKLTKQNEELIRDADERVAFQAKISLLESRNEMLQSEMEIKAGKEKEYLRQIDDSQKAYNHETGQRKRLFFDNEALKWQLKQRSEQLHIIEAKLQESMNSTSSPNQHSNSSFNRSTLQNGSSVVNINVEVVSPPASPVVKGVIEKTDSVSWVLEMDDDTPEAAASKMVKRAGSFRSVERSPSTRRQLSMSANATTSMMSNGGGCGNGPNPLSQSMSATVIRQHSSDAASEFVSRSHARTRSKSVSVKSGPEAMNASSVSTAKSSSGKKLLRQHSSGNTSRKHELSPGSWKDPISSSSPYSGMRPRSSTLKMDSVPAECQDESLFRRSSAASARKLITCDTSALISGERLELRSLPTHPSVHDLKVLKKCQEIQESAGEAMVSGTNSEDEGCSASSDEIGSSATTSTATSSSNSSLNRIKNSHSHMSLEEEELLLDKISSLNGTPMEVSWSDDAEAFANGAMV